MPNLDGKTTSRHEPQGHARIITREVAPAPAAAPAAAPAGTKAAAPSDVEAANGAAPSRVAVPPDDAIALEFAEKATIECWPVSLLIGSRAAWKAGR